MDIYEECKNRGYNVKDYSGSWDLVPAELMNDYIETDGDRQIVMDRIKESLEN